MTAFEQAALCQEERQTLATERQSYDVMFPRVVMPGLSGIELGQKIRRLYLVRGQVLSSPIADKLAQRAISFLLATGMAGMKPLAHSARRRSCLGRNDR